MVDYSELRKKFKPKEKKGVKKSSKAAIKAIQLEYERKKADLAGGAPLMSRGPLFYSLVILLLVVIGALVVPQLMRGGITLGKKRIERNELNARKS